jgi:PAS domain S-box-containing protein
MAAHSTVQHRRRLAALLRNRREELMRRWTRRVMEDPRVPRAIRQSGPDLRDQVPSLLDGLAHDLEAAEGGEAEGRVLGASQTAREHARHRAADGYRVVEALRGMSHLRAAILELCAEERVPVEGDAAQLLHAALDEYMRSCADEMERVIRERDKRVVETAVDAIITIDEHGRVEAFNPAAERMFGYQAREVVGQNVKMLMPEPFRSEHDGYLARYRQTGERRIIGIGREVTGRRKDGTTFPVHAAVSEARVDGRRIFTGMLHDLTERKKAEDERERLLGSERAARTEAEHALQLRDDFVATVSHELRTPLNAILGYTRMLRGGKLDAAAAAKALEVVERNARAQADLVEDLLDVSRIGSGKLKLDVQPVSIPEIVQNVVASHLPAAEAKGVSLDNALDDSCCMLRGDPRRLEQVVSNLLSNAIKFTPRGGHVRVTCLRTGSRAELVVRDTGAGIHADFLQHVFDRFRQADASLTRSHRGLGLGLAMVKALVEQHGGDVRAESEGEGRGATFTVSLPLAAIPRVEELPSEVDACAALAGVKALVIDDDEDARNLVSRILEDCRVEVTAAASAAEALARLPRARPDVLVSDIGMPGLDGYQLLRAVRALAPEQGGETPAVALTAFARPEERLRALEAGYQVHLAKPVNQSELLVAVARVTGRLRAGGEAVPQSTVEAPPPLPRSARSGRGGGGAGG